MNTPRADVTITTPVRVELLWADRDKAQIRITTTAGSYTRVLIGSDVWELSTTMNLRGVG